MVCQNPFFSDFFSILSLTADPSPVLCKVFLFLFFVLHYIFYMWQLVLVLSKQLLTLMLSSCNLCVFKTFADSLYLSVTKMYTCLYFVFMLCL